MAKYLFDRIGADRFQELCQALVLVDFPGAQCFPVGQPDGGRDALTRLGENAQLGIVVQVKQKTSADPDVEWLIASLEAEKPKIERLIARGATQYIMITNARGTAHLDGGRIDLVQKWFDENLAIPAMCWWLDDLERRLDKADAYSIRLAYPAVLTGEHAIENTLQALVKIESERRVEVLRTFVQEQYEKDARVKFRQLEISSSLLDLFIDVPVDVAELAVDRGRSETWNESATVIRRLGKRRAGYQHRSGVSTRRLRQFSFVAGAADILLDNKVQEACQNILLQGAPGQGKSTLAQYVCQVHRARFLSDATFLDELSETHLTSAFRVPVKIDLRDFAEFIEGRPVPGVETIPDGPKSLEVFLATQIANFSGGRVFTVDDVIALSKNVPMLMFFDGLDEVADLEVRHRVSTRVLEGLSRIRSQGANLQAVITTRPSLFGRNIFSDNQTFVTLELSDLGVEAINGYSRKWIAAKGLDRHESAEVKAILGNKLSLPHIRDLTRNPMQLAILLTLVHTMGYSLPDERTALYTSYVDRFLTREAEKDAVVRDKRHILVELVGFIAWTLQCRAEAKGSSGAISEQELSGLVEEFLAKHGEKDVAIAHLFAKGVERVYVLVQRVEGLYEFEVQPLREYFAAQYLYSSAPLVTARDADVTGDRAQRFEAMAVNPYWVNVARFYAGFYQGGELGSLVTSVREIISTKGPEEGISARALGASILSDWVMRKKKFVQSELLDAVLDEQVGLPLVAKGLLPGFSGSVLDVECGRDRLADRVLDFIKRNQESGEGPLYARVLAAHLRPDLSEDIVHWASEVTARERSLRIETALACGIEADLDGCSAKDLLLADAPDLGEREWRVRAVLLWAPQLLDLAELNDLGREIILDLTPDSQGPTEGIMGAISATVSGSGMGPEEAKYAVASSKGDKLHLQGSVNLLNQVTTRSIVVPNPVTATAADWARYINALLAEFPDSLVAINAITRALVHLPYRGDNSADPSALLSIALGWRRARSRTSFMNTMRSVEGGRQKSLLFISIVLNWFSTSQLADIETELAKAVESLDDNDYFVLQSIVLRVGEAQRRRRREGQRERTPWRTSNIRLARLAYLSIGWNYVESLTESEATDLELSEEWEQQVVLQSLKDFEGWRSVSSEEKRLAVLKITQSAMKIGAHLGMEFLSKSTPDKLPPSVVASVLATPGDYPQELVSMAYGALFAKYRPRPLAEIASTEDWEFA